MMVKAEGLEISGFRNMVEGLFRQADHMKDSDSTFESEKEGCCSGGGCNLGVVLGDKDERFLQDSLSVSSAFLNEVHISCRLTAPSILWNLLDGRVYSLGPSLESIIKEKEFSREDFTEEYPYNSQKLDLVIQQLNILRKLYFVEQRDCDRHNHLEVMSDILADTPYMVTRSISVRYLDLLKLVAIHYLDYDKVWEDFRTWVLSLPHADFLMGCVLAQNVLELPNGKPQKVEEIFSNAGLDKE